MFHVLTATDSVADFFTVAVFATLGFVLNAATVAMACSTCGLAG